QGLEPEYKAPLKRLKSWEDEYDEESFNRLKKWEKEKVYDDLAMALAKISGRVMEGDSLKVSGEAEAGTGRAVRELVAERYRITGRPLDWTMIYTKRHAYREETERPEVNYDPNAHNDFYKLGVIEFGAENDFAAEEAFEKAMEIALGKLEEKRRELTKMQADNKVSRETVAKTEREVKKWEELITRYSLTLGVMKHFTGQWDKEKIREAIPHYAKYLEDKQRKRDFAEEEKLSKAEKMKFELAMRLKKGAEPKKNAPKGLTMKEIRWMNVDGEGHAPAAFRFLYKLIAPHKPFEEYAVNTDPKIEEGIFTLLPFAVLSVLLWHGTVGFTGFLTGMGISYGTFVLAHLPNIVRAPPEDASIIDRVRMVLSEPLTFKNLARAFKAPLIVAVQNLYLTAVYGYLITLLSPMNAYMIFPVILAVFAYISAVEGHKETNLQAVREKKFAPAAIGGIPGKEDRSGKRKLSRIMEKDGYKTTYAVIKDLNVRNALVMVSIFILLATLGQWVHFFMTAGPRITNLLMIGSPLAIIWFILGLRAFKKAPVGTAAAGPGPAQAPGTMTKTKPSVVLDLKPWAAYLLLGLSSISFASLAVPMALFSWYPGLVGVNVGLLLAFSTYTLLHETGHGLPLHFLASEKAKHMRYSLTRKGLFFQVFMNIGEHARSIPSWKYRFLCFTGPLMGFLSFTLVNIYFIFNPANYTGAALPIHAFMLHMPLLIFLIFTGVGVMNLLPFFKGSDGKKIWRLGVETSAGEGLPVEIAEEIQKHLQARKILVDSRIEKGNKNSAGIDGNGKLRITIRGKKQVNVDEAKKAIDKLFGVSPAERGKTSAPGSLWSLDEDYAVHKAPWIEEGLFTAAPFAVFATLNMIGKMGFWGFWLGMAIVYGIFTGAHIVNYFRAPPKMKEENLFARIRWTFKAPVTVASFNLLITAIAALIISSISSLDASIIGTLFMAGIFTWPVFYINRSFHKFINFMAKGQTDHAPAAIKRKRFEDNEITQEAIESYTQEHVAAFSPTYRNIIEAITE
ncbi:MAG: hypothetical protein PVH45_05640, partial [Candidatus Omnitrophota bacterium]